MPRTCRLCFAAMTLVMATSSLWANGPRPVDPATSRWRMGVEIRAEGGPCKGLVATLPMPTEWPEQKVTVVSAEATPPAKIAYRTLDGGVKQIVVTIPTLASGATASAEVVVEVVKHSLTAPESHAELVLPKAPTRETARYLLPSPYIETQHAKIKELAAELVAGKDSAWQKVEALYDGVRERVKYVDGDLKGALAALNDGTGDCEELTSLFIAVCRANKIPARTVWVPGHCYPEFYLENTSGEGYWFPCQAAGTRAFGEMREARPILQKGDNFRLPEHREPQRYVAETLKGTAVRGAGNPVPKFFREPVVNP